jgi:hypothetical protein
MFGLMNQWRAVKSVDAGGKRRFIWWPVSMTILRMSLSVQFAVSITASVGLLLTWGLSDADGSQTLPQKLGFDCHRD